MANDREDALAPNRIGTRQWWNEVRLSLAFIVFCVTWNRAVYWAMDTDNITMLALLMWASLPPMWWAVQVIREGWRRGL